MAAGKVRLSVEALASFLAQVFAARGMSSGDARAVADVLAWADARGVSSHGITRAPRYLGFIDKGQLDPKAVPTLAMSAGATYLVDGHRSAGAVALKMALAEGGAIARTMGVSFGVVRNTTHTGAIGYYAHKAIESGLAAIMFAAGPPLMAYHGTRVASLSTSPITIGVPTDTGPVVLDMATSVVSNGRLKQATQAGQPIPSDWALTAEGEPTTDPNLAEIPLPLGGPKGAGLALMFEMLSGVLGGSSLLLEQMQPGAKRRQGASASVLLIDIARFRPLAEFTKDAASLGQLIKGLSRSEGVSEILLPGERGARHLRGQITDGVQVSASAWKKLVEAAGALGVSPPAVQSA